MTNPDQQNIAIMLQRHQCREEKTNKHIKTRETCSLTWSLLFLLLWM